MRASRPGPKHMLVCLDAALPGIKSFSGSHLHASMNAGILSRSPPRYSISSTCLKWLASLDVLVARVNPGPQIADANSCAVVSSATACIESRVGQLIKFAFASERFRAASSSSIRANGMFTQHQGRPKRGLHGSRDCRQVCVLIMLCSAIATYCGNCHLSATQPGNNAAKAANSMDVVGKCSAIPLHAFIAFTDTAKAWPA